MEAKNKYNWRLVLGPVILLGGIILGIFWSGFPPYLVSFLTALGAVFIVIGIRMMKYGDSAKGDERTRKIWAYSAAYSWWLTYVAIAALYLVDYLKIVELTVGSILGILLVTISLSQIIISWILSRKGDIQ
jgi:hypothetical protein